MRSNFFEAVYVRQFSEIKKRHICRVIGRWKSYPIDIKFRTFYEQVEKKKYAAKKISDHPGNK